VTPNGTGCVVPAGTVSVVIVPNADSNDPQPMPSPGLIEEVRAYLQKRAALGVAVNIDSPKYVQIGIETVLVPKDPTDAGPLVRKAEAALAAYLNPVSGGTSGQGWGFGRSVYRSDVAAVLYKKLSQQLAYAEDISLLVDGIPAGDQVKLPADALPCAGTIRVLPRIGEAPA
jgi:hypothetical protein